MTGTRTWVVTGAASGIGAAVAAAARADGDRVIGVDLRDVDVCADLEKPAGRASAVTAVRDLVQADADGRIDRLVCCAGVGPNHPSTRIAAVDHFATVAVLEGLGDLVAAAGPGATAVVIGSHAATITPLLAEQAALVDVLADAAPDAAGTAGAEDAALAQIADVPGYAVYAIAKAALHRACRRLAVAWGPQGVRLNVVAPGPVETPLLDSIAADPLLGAAARALPTPLGRTGTTDDIVAAVRFLAGDASAFCCGTVLVVDGGTDAVARP